MNLKQVDNLLRRYGLDDRQLKRCHITRIMRTDHFLEMISQAHNVLPRVLKWEDVYEGYVTRVKIENLRIRDLLRDYYGQCWSFRTMESELLWMARDYNGEKYKHDVVMIETTVYDLLRSVADICQDVSFAYGLVKVAAVDYSLPKQLIDDDVKQPTCSAAAMLNSFFLKRPQFSDEKELRMVFDVRGGVPHRHLNYKISKGLLYYELKNKSMFSRVLCHPKMSLKRVAAIKRCLKTNGWNCKAVGRSDLYQLPKRAFKIF